MTPAIILRPRAERDVRSAFEWYELQSPGLGDEFLNTLYERLERIGSHPKAFPVIYKNIRRAVVPKFPYLAFYVAEPSRVVVLAILHASRSPAIWPRRQSR